MDYLCITVFIPRASSKNEKHIKKRRDLVKFTFNDGPITCFKVVAAQGRRKDVWWRVIGNEGHICPLKFRVCKKQKISAGSNCPNLFGIGLRSSISLASYLGLLFPTLPYWFLHSFQNVFCFLTFCNGYFGSWKGSAFQK